MYCGNCLRDNALVRELRKEGHQVLMVPLYLPLTLDERDESAGTPIFFGGISVYLEQQLPMLRHAPEWVDGWLSSPRLLKLASGRAAKTRASELGALTLSMLEGDAGKQAREIRRLIRFLKDQPKPDVICLSNLLLTGMARALKSALDASVVCMMQGEDSFLDALPDSHRARCWSKVAENTTSVDALVSTSRYYADLMRERLSLPEEKVRVVHSGISLDGYEPPAWPRPGPPILGFFARMCRDKGIDTLVEAFIHLKQRGQVPGLRLKIGGSCGPADESVVAEMKQRLEVAGLAADAEFHPNLDRGAKIRFLQSLSVFSVPARYGEAFGLYLVEAMAAGVPVVQPRTAAFPELIEKSGAGLLFAPDDPQALAEGIEQVLLSPELATQFSAAGRRAARDLFSVQCMARNTVSALESIVRGAAQPGRTEVGARSGTGPRAAELTRQSR